MLPQVENESRQETATVSRGWREAIGTAVGHPAVSPLTVVAGIASVAWGGFLHSAERGCYLLGSLLIALPLAIHGLQFLALAIASRRQPQDG